MNRALIIFIVVMCCASLITACTNNEAVIDTDLPSNQHYINIEDYQTDVYCFYSSLLNFSFNEGDVVPIDRVMPYFCLVEMRDNSGKMKEEYCEYKTSNNRMDYEIEIPKNIVNQYIEEHFSIFINDKESKYLSEDGQKYVIQAVARGQIYTNIVSAEESNGIVTLTCEGGSAVPANGPVNYNDNPTVLHRFILKIKRNEDFSVKYLSCHEITNLK